MTSTTEDCLLENRVLIAFSRICLATLLVVSLSPNCFGEERDVIELGGIGSRSSGGRLTNLDPRVHFYSPPKNTQDSYRLTSKGLEIVQRTDIEGAKPWVAGFSTTVMMKKDFRVQLDLDCDIEPPESGWGQGVILIVTLDDDKSSEVKIGRVVGRGGGSLCRVEISSAMIEKPTYIPVASAIESGSLVIQRIGSKFSFFEIENDQEKLLHELSYSAASVRNVKVICTRQDEGNGPAKYLLKKLHLATDGFYAFEEAKESWFNWWRLLIAIHLLAIVGLVIRAIRKQPK